MSTIDLTPEEQRAVHEAIRKYNEAWGPSWRRMEAAVFNLFTKERKPMKTIEQLNADYVRTHAEWGAAGFVQGAAREAHFEAREQLLEARHNKRRNAMPVNPVGEPSAITLIQNYIDYHWGGFSNSHRIKSLVSDGMPNRADLEVALKHLGQYQDKIDHLQFELERLRTKAQYANEPYVEMVHRCKTLSDEIAVLRHDNNRLTDRIGKMKAQVAAS